MLDKDDEKILLPGSWYKVWFQVKKVYNGELQIYGDDGSIEHKIDLLNQNLTFIGLALCNIIDNQKQGE